MKPTILCYAELSYNTDKVRKSFRYDCTTFAGYCPSFEELKNKDGVLFVYLQTSHSNGNRKDSNTTPDMYLQGRRSINISGLHYFYEDGVMSDFCSGYPSQKEWLGSKNPIKNPFYPDNINDCFLFIIHRDGNSPVPTSIEMLVLKDARVLVDAYRKQLMLGGFDDELKLLRQQAKSTTL